MRILAAIAVIGIVLAILAAVFFFGGFYSVAGTAEDPAIVRWALVQVRTASINRHAHDQPPSTFNDPRATPASFCMASSRSRLW